MFFTGGIHMYAAFSSPIKENESDIVKSKQKLNPESMFHHLHPKTYLTQQSLF
jgi:hypothetical protein